ncbi:AfsR/SARP family transcriptional regulator [Piscinibacter terrae]|uniref:Response regulator receiver protein n=1 Tax=Piscinibacter terrae TaxID=2496871 RepID=A0A3N7IW91_9BURK|nr:BTAD domain-containing putative transcriptional regulator [Albitalea terrae]RQP23032.1 response regulator receiver protein [Albitalea terrae]
MLRLHLFGAVSFSLDAGDTGTADLPTHVSGRPGCLLAYLALARGRYFSRSDLMSVLWSDPAETVGMGTFNTVLWRLRKLIERPPMPSGSLIACDRRGAVGLHPQAPIQLDVDAFAQSVLPVLAKPLERMGESDVEALRQGIDLYTADILTDLGDEWALREREKHRRHYLNALGRMMQVCTLAGDFGSAIRYAQAILDRDVLREDVHRELMRLFLRSGQRALALRQFERCRAALRQELAIQPMAETLALYQSIANDAVSLESGLPMLPGAGMVPTLSALLEPAAPRTAMSARELIESARQHLARADAQLQLSLPFL